MDNKLKQQVARNVVANNLGEAAVFFLGLATIPIILGFLGTSRYGLFILLVSLVNYLSLLDFGIGAAVVKFVSQYQAQGSFENLKKTISSAFIFFLIVSFLVSILLFFSTDFLVEAVFKLDLELRTEAIAFFHLGSFLIFFRFMTNFFNILTHSYQRFDLYNIGKMVGILGTTLGLVIALTVSNSLFTVALIYIASTLAEGLVSLSLLLIKEGRVPLTLSFSLSGFRSIFKFGRWKFLMALSSQIDQLDKLIISFFLPLEFVSYYAIPQSLTKRLTSTLSVVSEPLFPFASFVNASYPVKIMQNLYKKATRLGNLLVMPTALFIAFFSKEILTFWLGAEFSRESSLVLSLLSLAYLLLALTAVPVKMVEAKGKPKVTAIFSFTSGFVRLILAIFLTANYGIHGLAVSLLIYALPTVVAFLSYTAKKIIRLKKEEILESFFESYLKPFVVSLSLLFPLRFFSPNSIFMLVSLFLIYGLLLLAALFLTSALKKEEVLGFINHLRRK